MQTSASGEGRKLRDATCETGKDSAAYNCLLRNELLGAGIEDLKV